MQFIRVVLAVVSLAALSASAAPRRHVQDAPRPNIVLVTVDTLRADRLGCYGYERNTSPNLDRLAGRALTFENCFSCAPLTGPSSASFLSGFLPHETTVWNNGVHVPAAVPMLAELLQQAGYRTYAVVSNYVLRDGQGFEQGFDVYDDDLGSKERNREMPERIAAKTTDAAIRLLKRHDGGEFFLWVHYQDPHGPYTPKPPYDRMFIRENAAPMPLEFGKQGIPDYQRLGDHDDFNYYAAQYDGEIRYWDEHFGRLIDAIKRAGYFDSSTIVVSSDHGEAMGEEGRFFSHGNSLGHRQIHVPLVIKHGGAAGRRGDTAGHLDLVPTLLAAVGLEGAGRYRGRDLLRAHAGPAVAYSELSPVRAAAIRDGLKLMTADTVRRLFDLGVDPAEARNLTYADGYEGRFAEMDALLARALAEDRLKVQPLESAEPLEQEELEKLKSLGYFQ